MDKLELYVPQLEELWFYRDMLSDPETMSYNSNWDVSYDGYHRDTGCIDFPRENWDEWHNHWVGHEPERFYAYIKRCSDGVWIGDVNFHYTPEKDWWDMGIVINSRYRGMGYAVPSLLLLLKHAFLDCNISRIHNEFELTRNEISAWKSHLSAGFHDTVTIDGVRHMIITREDFIREQQNN